MRPLATFLSRHAFALWSFFWIPDKD